MFGVENCNNLIVGIFVKGQMGYKARATPVCKEMNHKVLQQTEKKVLYRLISIGLLWLNSL